jgi:3',5'-cyclic AMP phosphodiesterase CpdA
LVLWLLAAGPAQGADAVAPAGPLQVAAVSDINGRYGTVDYAPRVAAAVERATELDVDVFLIAGDMIAGQRPSPLLRRGELEAMWERFHATVTEPLAARGIPVLVTPGNHDASRQPPFGLERTVYAEQWAQRRPAVQMLDGDHWPFHYAAGIGGALIVSLDATEPGRLPDRQLEWLEQVLDREQGRFETIIVFGHLPLWPIAVGRETEILRDPRLRDLLAEREVDAYLSGHHHAFYDGTYGGVRYIAQAALGGGRRALAGTKARSPHALTLLTLAPEKLRVEALLAPGYRDAINPAMLPGVIESPLGRLRRSADAR